MLLLHSQKALPQKKIVWSRWVFKTVGEISFYWLVHVGILVSTGHHGITQHICVGQVHPKFRPGNTTISSQSSVRTQRGKRTQKLKSMAAASGCWMLFIRPSVVVVFFVVCSLLIPSAYLDDHLIIGVIYLSFHKVGPFHWVTRKNHVFDKLDFSFVFLTKCSWCWGEKLCENTCSMMVRQLSALDENRHRVSSTCKTLK